MMISLGYYFDQVSRERMTERIAQRTQLIAGRNAGECAVGRGDTLWVDTAHPVYHELETTWRVGDAILTESRNQPFLDLSRLRLPRGCKRSRRPSSIHALCPRYAIRANALTATRAWTVAAADAASSTQPAPPSRLAGSTQTTRPIGGR